MRHLLTCLIFILSPFASFSREVRDTVCTRQGDKIILSYAIMADGNRRSINVSSPPRIIPSESLRKTCKGDLTKLKAVIFDQVGINENVKWKGLTPSAFMVPAGVTYDRSDDGYYIFGESAPLTFTTSGASSCEVRFPVYVALYEKKRTYRIVSDSSQPLSVKLPPSASRGRQDSHTDTRIEEIAISATEEVESDNDDITKALNSIRLIRQLLEYETEFPFSLALTTEIQSLRALKDRISDEDVIEKINALSLELNQKERELKQQASLSEQTQQQALQAQQRQEAEEREKAAEEKARVQEEKQQKRTLWMIIGGALLAAFGFIGNAIFKHFRDIRNQKSIMQMQESIAKQAEYEASRRSREIVRNKAHQMANKGKGKLRESIQSSTKTTKNSKRKSI